MRLNRDTNILIVGLGLIGGSYAMSLTRHGYNVKAITLNQEDIDYAVENNIIKAGSVSIDPEMIAESQLIIFSLYPHIFINWIKENQKYFTPGTLITDVTGVKQSVVYEIQDALRDDVEFIAAHPMAGREVYGVQNADDRIFRDANYIVTPTDKNTAEAIEICEQLGDILGFRHISRLTPEEHDDMIGFLSQLTHCIAISLMNSNDSDSLAIYSGDSFRDLTRIARINENMWTELFLMNKKELIGHMEKFEAQFNRLKHALINDDEDTIKEMMIKSTARRSMFDKKE